MRPSGSATRRRQASAHCILSPNPSDTRGRRVQDRHAIHTECIPRNRGRLLEGRRCDQQPQPNAASAVPNDNTGNDVYTRLMKKKRERDARVERLRIQQMEEELTHRRQREHSHPRPLASPSGSDSSTNSRLLQSSRSKEQNTITPTSAATTIRRSAASSQTTSSSNAGESVFDRLYRRSSASAQKSPMDAASTSHNSYSASSVASGMSTRLNELYNEGVRRNRSRPMSEKEERDRREMNMVLKDPQEFTFHPKTNWGGHHNTKRKPRSAAVAYSPSPRPVDRPKTGRIGIFPRYRNQQPKDLEEAQQQQPLLGSSRRKPQPKATPLIPKKRLISPKGSSPYYPMLAESPPREIVITSPLRLGAAPLTKPQAHEDPFAPFHTSSPLQWHSPPQPIRKTVSPYPQQQATLPASSPSLYRYVKQSLKKVPAKSPRGGYPKEPSFVAPTTDFHLITRFFPDSMATSFGGGDLDSKDDETEEMVREHEGSSSSSSAMDTTGSDTKTECGSI